MRMTAAPPCAPLISFVPDACPKPEPIQDERFDQLRHQTKNALQSILNIVSTAPELDGIQGGQALRDTLQQRILVAADLSNALFGLTRHAGSLDRRLDSLARDLVCLLGEAEAAITISVKVDSGCPVPLHDTLIRIANELIGNAVKHGMHARLKGRIDIMITASPIETILTVMDDGWGYGRSAPPQGEGLAIVRRLVRAVGGQFELSRAGLRTASAVSIPRSRYLAHTS